MRESRHTRFLPGAAWLDGTSRAIIHAARRPLRVRLTFLSSTREDSTRAGDSFPSLPAPLEPSARPPQLARPLPLQRVPLSLLRPLWSPPQREPQ